MHVIAASIEKEHACAPDDVVLQRTTLCHVMFVQRGPGTEVIPAEIRRQAKDFSFRFSLSRTRFENGIINADAFTLRIQSAQNRSKFASAESRGDLLQQGSGFGEMLAQSVGQRAGAPQEHSAVPEIIPCTQKTSRFLGAGFLGEARPAHSMGAGKVA